MAAIKRGGQDPKKVYAAFERAQQISGKAARSIHSRLQAAIHPRRMTAAVGHPTLRLVRIAIGDWTLGELRPGEYRIL